MMKMLMVMMMVLIYIANQSYLVAVPAVLSLLLGRSFGLDMIPEPLELLPVGSWLLLEAYGSHDQWKLICFRCSVPFIVKILGQVEKGRVWIKGITSQSVRTGLIVVLSSHAKAIFEKYDRGVDDDDDKFCDDDDSFLLDCKFCCMTTKYVGIAYKFCISIDHLMFYVQNKLVRKKVFFILSCFYRTIVLKPKKKKEKVAD